MEQYVKYSISDKDDILSAINKLNHLSQLLTAAKYLDFVDKRLREVLLLSYLLPSWKVWKDALSSSTTIDLLSWDSVVEKICLEVQRRSLETTTQLESSFYTDAKRSNKRNLKPHKDKKPHKRKNTLILRTSALTACSRDTLKKSVERKKLPLKRMSSLLPTSSLRPSPKNLSHLLMNLMLTA